GVDGNDPRDLRVRFRRHRPPTGGSLQRTRGDPRPPSAPASPTDRWFQARARLPRPPQLPAETSLAWPTTVRGAMEVERSFVIADLVGYTAAVDAHGDETALSLADALGDAATRSLARDDELVKTMGDAVLVASRTPTGAVSF